MSRWFCVCLLQHEHLRLTSEAKEKCRVLGMHSTISRRLHLRHLPAGPYGSARFTRGVIACLQEPLKQDLIVLDDIKWLAGLLQQSVCQCFLCSARA